MKTNKIKYIIIAVLLIVTITIAGIVLAENIVGTDSSLPEKDRTNVLLVPEQKENGEYTGAVDVYLQMDDGIVVNKDENQAANPNDVEIKDAASIASFQIGLDINLDAEDVPSKVDFTYDTQLQEGNKDVKLATTKEESIRDAQGKEIGETLDLYFVGTKELNDVNSSENLKVGTIKLNTTTLGENAVIRVTPKASPSTVASSIGYNETEIDVRPVEDKVEYIVNYKEADHEGEDSGDTNTSGGDGNTSGDTNTSGDGNTSGDTNTNTGGSGSTNTGGDGNTNTGGSGNTNTGGSGSQGGTGSAGDSGSGNTSTPHNNGWSSKDPDKGQENGGSLLDKIGTALKTGENRSVTVAVIGLVILTIIATGIVIIKTRGKGKAKHRK